MNIEGSIALVTGANRGLGAAFCRTLLERGAAKVYAGGPRHPQPPPRRRHPRATRRHLGDRHRQRCCELR